MIPIHGAIKYMAWADDKLFHFLRTIPAEAWKAKVNDDDWPVFGLAFHLIATVDWFCFELGYEPVIHDEPSSVEELLALGTVWRDLNAILIQESLKDDELLSYEEDGNSYSVNRSSVLFEAFHHSVEHRVQIATALKSNGYSSPNLDEYSERAYREALLNS
jgi:uncharacterized damage-inducible protein DinB